MVLLKSPCIRNKNCNKEKTIVKADYMILCLCCPVAVQSLNNLNDQIASFMVTRPKPLEQEEQAYSPPEKETLQKSMNLMRHLLVDAQVQILFFFFSF